MTPLLIFHFILMCCINFYLNNECNLLFINGSGNLLNSARPLKNRLLIAEVEFILGTLTVLFVLVCPSSGFHYLFEIFKIT